MYIPRSYIVAVNIFQIAHFVLENNDQSSLSAFFGTDVHIFPDILDKAFLILRFG
jgi:hypothetical protein